MLQTNAVFRGKESTMEKTNCAIEKIIKLSGAEYDSFADDLFEYQDFIKDNIDLMYRSADGSRHCLLVVGENRRDGILVDSSGYDYARYTALIPNVEEFLTVGQSPSLAVLNQRLTDIADDIVKQVGAEQTGDRSVIDLDDIDARFGIDLMTNGALRSVVFDMLGERPEIPDFENDKNRIIFHREDARVVEHPHGDNKPSVRDQLKVAQKAPEVPKEKQPSSNKKDKGCPEL